MSTEQKTGEESFADLVAGLRAAVPELEPSASLLPELRRRYAHRTALRRAGYAAIPVALVAAVGVGAVLAPHGGPAPLAAKPAPPKTSAAPTIRDAAELTALVDKALANADHDVLEEHRDIGATAFGKPVPEGQHGTEKSWVSMNTRERHTIDYIDGTPDFESGDSAPGTFTVLNYPDHTYLSFPAEKAPADPVHDTFTPDEIKSAMASGKLAITAQNQQVDGQSTIELTGTLIPSDERGPYATAVPQRFWVNSTTYLPVRQAKQDGNGNWVQAVDYTWLAPTPENEALLAVRIPAGFTRKN